MPTAGLVHRIPFETVNSKAVDEGRAARRQAHVIPDRPRVLTVTPAKRSAKHRFSSALAGAGSPDGQRIGKKAQGVGTDLGRQDMVCRRKIEEGIDSAPSQGSRKRTTCTVPF